MKLFKRYLLLLIITFSTFFFLSTETQAVLQARLIREQLAAKAEVETQRLAAEAQRQVEAETQRQAEEKAKRIAAKVKTQQLADEEKARQIAAEAQRQAEAETQRLATEAQRQAKVEAQRLAAEVEAKRLATKALQIAVEAKARQLAAEAEVKRLAAEEAHSSSIFIQSFARRIIAKKKVKAERIAFKAKSESNRLAAEAARSIIAQQKSSKISRAIVAKRKSNNLSLAIARWKSIRDAVAIAQKKEKLREAERQEIINSDFIDPKLALKLARELYKESEQAIALRQHTGRSYLSIIREIFTAENKKKAWINVLADNIFTAAKKQWIPGPFSTSKWAEFDVAINTAANLPIAQKNTDYNAHSLPAPGSSIYRKKEVQDAFKELTKAKDDAKRKIKDLKKLLKHAFPDHFPQ